MRLRLSSGFMDVLFRPDAVSAGDVLVSGSAFGLAFKDDDGDTLEYTFSGSQTDGTGDAMTWLELGVSGGLVVKSGTSISDWEGVWSLTITASDGSARVESGFTISIIDNAAPVHDGTAITATGIAENAVVGTEITSAEVTSGFSDTDGDTLSYTILGKLGSATEFTDQTWLEVDSTDGKIQLAEVPDDAEVGSWTLKVRADDSRGGVVDSGTFTLMVSNVNDDPEASSTAIATTGISGSIAENVAVGTDISDGEVTSLFSDEDGDTLTYKILGQLGGSGGFTEQAWLGVDSSDGKVQIVVSPDDAQVGEWVLKVQADDGKGGTAAESATFALEVTNVEEAPKSVGTPTATHAFAKGVALSSTATSLSFTFTDEDGDALSFKVSGTIDGNSDDDTSDSVDKSLSEITVSTTAQASGELEGLTLVRGSDAAANVLTLGGTPGVGGDWKLTITVSDSDDATADLALVLTLDVEGGSEFSASAEITTDGDGNYQKGNVADSATISYTLPEASDPNGDAITYALSYKRDGSVYDGDDDSSTADAPSFLTVKYETEGDSSTRPVGFAIDREALADGFVGNWEVVLTASSAGGEASESVSFVVVAEGGTPPEVFGSPSGGTQTVTEGAFTPFTVTFTDSDGIASGYTVSVDDPTDASVTGTGDAGFWQGLWLAEGDDQHERQRQVSDGDIFCG